jgi:hypothetical protein
MSKIEVIQHSKNLGSCGAIMHSGLLLPKKKQRNKQKIPKLFHEIKREGTLPNSL